MTRWRIAWVLACCLLAGPHAPGARGGTGTGKVTTPRAQRVILFVIDGLAARAPERFSMPNLLRLAGEGCRYEAMHLPLPGHPKNDPRYPWSCSMPNPMLMAGTPFIGTDGIRTAMIQHQFEEAQTAFVVNAYSYKDVSGGFGVYLAGPHNPDAWVIERAKEVLLEKKPVFMRVHLQRAGIEGDKVSRSQYAKEPWYRDIWHAESPYRMACERADGHLGEFVQWLKEQDLWKDAVLLVCGDHGQADEGWHEPYSTGSSVTPLVVVGAGVVEGRTAPHCEIYDVAPTIASLTGRPAPSGSMGRVLSEAFDAGAPSPATESATARLNQTLRAAHALKAKSMESLRKAGFLGIDEVALWHTTPAGTDFAAFVARQRGLLGGGR